ncbi:Cysteine--tRNA ligase [Seminavis robusta]|uniref:cysteine--tRNA ligase n=1 Tax=Seminavis robusta TaxID=568900 RepID=A0A9N8H3I0_9STRA|nr:Cysteine--tRNA ligase [Seminavis robusta]|eukprot:Sro27_g018040.1 Cysteine--tRNA ligase (815) ;mRNA; r:17376-19820
MSLAGAGKLGSPTSTFDPSGRRHPWHPPAIDTSSEIAQGQLLMNNTLTGTKQPFIPLNGRTVRWYTCGPTVYDSSHVGHARTYLSLDIMRRIMTDYFHYNVLYQVNVTDIDDKIIVRARQNLLLENLTNDVTSNKLSLDDLKSLIQTAVQEAQDKAASKKVQIEAALKEATEKSDSRARVEQEELLKQHQVKQKNLAADVTKIQAADNADAKTMIQAAKSVLADKLDREKGHEVTDHSVFLKHARYYEREFMEDMKALGIREPDVLTRVTEYIPQIKDFIAKIVDRNMAYESNGSVYLSLDAFTASGHNYRKLSPAVAGTETSAAELAESEGALASGGDSEKRNTNDFALWKSSKPGEPAWESPWGPGRPGWHIECSVVASDILGENLDIHSGGEDLKFPHHDNELAQSEACLGKCIGTGDDQECHQWVNYFTHTGHLSIAGLKMSKSLKNFITIRQALGENTPRQLRILFLMQGWDQPMNYSDQTVDDARSKENTFKAFFREVEALSRNDYLDDEIGWRMLDQDRKLADALLDTQQKVHESLLDNFNTKDAMLALMSVISQANVYLRIPDVKPAVLTLKSIAVYVTQILKVFGVVTGNDDFGFETSGAGEGDDGAAANAVIDVLVSFREQVRNEALAAVKASKDDPAAAARAIQSILQNCDLLRDEVMPTVGVRVEDRADGSRWNREDPATMMKEIQEKKAKEAAVKKDKMEKKLVAKDKELKKLQESMVAPDQLFRKTEEYKEWDDRGVPTVNADGSEVSKGQTKKLTKAIDKQKKLYDDLMAKSEGTPQSLLDAVEAEIKTIKEGIAALSI